MTITELSRRKAKADALPAEERRRYAAEYFAVTDEMQEKLISLSMLCDEYSAAFPAIDTPDGIDRLAAVAARMREVVG